MQLYFSNVTKNVLYVLNKYQMVLNIQFFFNFANESSFRYLSRLVLCFNQPNLFLCHCSFLTDFIVSSFCLSILLFLQAMANFNMNRFLGTWYEAERYFTVTELGTRCVTTHYTATPEGRILVTNEITNSL